MVPREIQHKDLPFPVFERAHGWLSLQPGELWHYSELLYSLTRRDIKIRYKQMALRVTWAVLKPLIIILWERLRPFFLGMYEQPIFLEWSLLDDENYPMAVEKVALQEPSLPSSLALTEA